MLDRENWLKQHGARWLDSERDSSPESSPGSKQRSHNSQTHDTSPKNAIVRFLEAELEEAKSVIEDLRHARSRQEAECQRLERRVDELELASYRSRSKSPSSYQQARRCSHAAGLLKTVESESLALLGLAATAGAYATNV